MAKNKKSVGKPAEFGHPMKSYLLKLDLTTEGFYRKLGKGNRSQGARIAARLASILLEQSGGEIPPVK